MICIYHSRDLDGYTSGAIVKRKYPEAKLIGYDYGEPFPFDKIGNGEDVIMIDVSLKMPEMRKLGEQTGGKLIYIDHHKSAISDFEKECLTGKFVKSDYVDGISIYRTPEMCAVLKDGIAACEVGWKYLFPGEALPKSVELLGEYDTWRNGDKQKWENEILPFQFGMRVKCNSPETFPVCLFDTLADVEPIYKITDDGRTVLAYQAMISETNCKKSAFEHEFKGLRAICMNVGGINSDAFKSIYDPEKHDIVMPFYFTGKHWSFSLYSSKPEIDVSVIAKSMGGGGHFSAAGFESKDIYTVFPFMKKLK